LSIAKAILAYFVLRLRFERTLSALTALLFVISPLTTARQSLNLELTAAPGYFFAFAAILLYVRGRCILAFIAAGLAMLTYEPMVFLFVTAPLFRKDTLDRKALIQLARHAALCAAIFVAYFVWRRYSGEFRSAGIALGPAIIWHLASFDLMYSIDSFKSYLYGAYVGTVNLSIEAAFYTAAVFIPAVIFALRLAPAETESQREKHHQLMDGVWLGGLLVLLSFVLAYFQLGGSTTWPLAGRDTRAALATTFGSSLFVASLFLLLANALTRKLARRAVMAVFLLFLSTEFAYSMFIQQDYVSVWRHDVSLLNQAIMLTPDAGPDSTLIIDGQSRRQSMFPGEERMPSIGYQTHGLVESLRVLSRNGIAVPRIAVVLGHGWVTSLEFGADGMLHWRDKIVANAEEPLVPGRIILLKECPGGFLVRSERELTVHGRAVQQRRDRDTGESGWKRFLEAPLVEQVLGELPWYVTAVNTQAAKEAAAAVDVPISELLDDPHFSKNTLILEAERFSRGTAVADYASFGHGIGVVVTASVVPAFVEYDLKVPSEGHYDMYIRYAAAEPRPMTVAVNGREITESACSEVTGGWDPSRQRWQKAGSFYLAAGSNRLRLSRSGVFPAIDKIALRPSR
jgi:hypothetical protein